jgi:hypothetical protein
MISAFKLLVLLGALFVFATCQLTEPAADAGACNAGTDEPSSSVCAAAKREDGSACVVANDGQCYEKLCSEAFDKFHEIRQLAQADARAFAPRAWAWIEAAGKCVHAVDFLKLPSLTSQSSGVLEGYIASMMRSVLPVDKEPVALPQAACNRLLWQKKTLVNMFHARIKGGGIHPELKIKASGVVPARTAVLFYVMMFLAEISAQRHQLRRLNLQPSDIFAGGVFIRRY